MINFVHPFREGNGRAMRQFIEQSAEHYGFRARMIGGIEWLKASHEAMDHRNTGGLKSLIAENTTDQSSRVGDNVLKEIAHGRSASVVR